MAFNGSGVFQRLYSWVNDAAANIKIRADRMDNEMNGFATGLSTCLTKDGQTTVTANLPMATFRHTGVGNAASRTDYAAFGQVQDGKAAWVDGGGTADAITAAYSIPITTLVDGQLCYVRATAANATTTPTFSPNGLTARTIVKNGGQALVAGDIAGDGHELELRYDLPNTHWELMNPRSQNVPFTPASAATSAYLDFAEDTDNGTNRVRVIAPASIAADVSVTLPGTADTLVGRDTTDTLTNKTLTSPVINGTISGSAPIISSVVQQVFASSGTYTPTSGMKFCIVEAVGGGGGGGGAATSTTGNASGGGAGSYSMSRLTAAQIGASQTVTIGAGGNGGTAGNNGAAGGNTSLGSLVTTNGGGAGSLSNGVNQSIRGGAGGAVGTGSVTVKGGDGAAGFGAGTGSQGAGGNGGNSYFGAGGAGGANSGGLVGAVGDAGAGGGGGYGGSGGTGAAGGNGGSGRIIITEFI